MHTCNFADFDVNKIYLNLNKDYCTQVYTNWICNSMKRRECTSTALNFGPAKKKCTHRNWTCNLKLHSCIKEMHSHGIEPATGNLTPEKLMRSHRIELATCWNGHQFLETEVSECHHGNSRPRLMHSEAHRLGTHGWCIIPESKMPRNQSRREGLRPPSVLAYSPSCEENDIGRIKTMFS